MSVLIKDMEMPKACLFCELYEADLYWCRGAKRDVVDSETVADFCPLVPVPPHGRLIDGDKLAEEQKENVRAYHANLITLDDLAECLLKQSISEDGAPTIIPAEEGE
jgi:hypothetical protein